MKKSIYLFLLLLSMAITACTGDSKDKAEDQESTAATTDNDENAAATTGANGEPANLQEAMNQAQKAIKDAGVQQVEPVNFRKLQELLPEKLSGFERTSKGGETAGALGMTISKAEGKYKNSDGKTVSIDVIDTGGLGMGMMGMAAWASATIDKEDEKGYERTSTMDGYKCFEKYRKDRNSSELSVLLENRFVVTANARDCEMDELKKVVKAMDLGKLGKMK